MSADKLLPNDPRVREETAVVRGKTYQYYVGEPKGRTAPIETVFLIHGFPDAAFGWRCQVPFLTSLGFRVVVPNMLGYGGTDAPTDLAAYSLRSMSDDIKALATKFVGEDGQIVLGGHDWGGFLVWRCAEWHPKLIKAVFSVCTPYNPPSKTWVSLEDHIAAGRVKNFTYQLQLAGPDVEKGIQTREKVRQFLNGMFGGLGPNGEVPFIAEKGVLLENLSKLNRSRLVSDKELDYYADQYMLHKTSPLRGPLNWYRTRKINHDEDLPLAQNPRRLEMPALFITATRDSALPPYMSIGMERSFRELTRGEVDASHWALTQAPGEVNGQIKDWLVKVLGRDLKANL